MASNGHFDEASLAAHSQKLVLCYKIGPKGILSLEVLINQDIILNVYKALTLKLPPPSSSVRWAS